MSRADASEKPASPTTCGAQPPGASRFRIMKPAVGRRGPRRRRIVECAGIAWQSGLFRLARPTGGLCCAVVAIAVKTFVADE